MAPRKAYERAKPWNQTRADIDALLAKHLIDDVQWTTAAVRERGVLRFSKHLLEGAYNPPKDKIVAVEIEFAFPLNGADRNRAMRHLYWYLKAKLEAVEFRLGDGTRMFDFEREFFAHIMVKGDGEQTRTVYDILTDGMIEGLRNARVASDDDVIALPPVRAARHADLKALADAHRTLQAGGDS